MYKCVFIILFAWLIPLQAQDNNNGTASPESLVRRLFLDLYNRLPMEDEYLKAKGKIEKNQYNQLIAEMLKTSEFQKNLAAKIIDHYKPDMPVGFDFLYLPLQEHIVNNYTGLGKDFRNFLKDYLTAEGIQYSNPMTIFYASDEKTPDMASRISQRVVGLPLNCARCHDHKDYDKIKHEDFWEFASFFNMTEKQLIFQVRQVNYIENKIKNEESTFTKSIGLDNVNKIKRWIEAEKQGQNIYLQDVDKSLSGMASMFNGGMKKVNALDVAKMPQMLVLEKEIDLSRLRIRFKAETEVKTAYATLPTETTKLKGTSKPRQVLADWVISTRNPYTAKAVSSWVTNWLLGHSFITPLTDVYGGSGPRKNVLDQCAKILKQKNWDMTKFVASILTSEFYKMKTAVKNDEEQFVYFKQRRARHLTGDQIFQTITKYTGPKVENAKLNKIIAFKNQQDMVKLNEQLFPSSLDDEKTSYNGSLGQTLFMSNNDKILSFINQLARNGYQSQASEEAWLGQTIRSMFTREPTPQEITFFKDHLDKTKPYDSSNYFDVLWAIVNSPEMRLY